MFKSSLYLKNNITKLLSKNLYSYSSLSDSISNVFKTKTVGEKVTIQGWVKSLRRMKDNTFVDVCDGSCSSRLQVIIPNSLKQGSLSSESSVVAHGTLNISPKGQLELNAETLEVCGATNLSDGYPFLPRKVYPPEYVRQYLHLRSRTKRFSSLLRVRDAATMAFHQHLHTRGYISIHTPILTSNDCEGAGEVFTVIPDNEKLLRDMKKDNISSNEAYFDKKVFLTVSGQLHLEAIAHGLSKVYTFGPTFRAENSRSKLHLAEFYMLEVETAFVDKIEFVLATIEDLLKNVTLSIQKACGDDLVRCYEKDEKIDLSWVEKKFGVMTYDEAVKIVEANKHECGEFNFQRGFSKQQEIFLVKYNGNIPLFVINWPKDMKPFYMRECENDTSKVSALDLLVPSIGELVGGSLRENSYDRLKSKVPNENSGLDWYLDLRKYGSVPTGGFGLGFERYLQFILGLNNIKDCIPYPRWAHSCNL